MGQDHGIVEKELMNGRVAREMTEEELRGQQTRLVQRQGQKEAREKERARAKARVKPDTATTAENRGTLE